MIFICYAENGYKDLLSFLIIEKFRTFKKIKL